MRILSLVFFILAVQRSPVAPLAAQAIDTLEINQKVKAAIGSYYDETSVGPTLTREERARELGWRCSADEGSECYGGNWTHTRCPADINCHPPADDLLTLLVESSRAHPESGFITGQAVFELAKFGRHLEAMEIAESCQASDWWCRGLVGHVLMAVGRAGDAELHFRRFLESAPDTVQCLYEDASWLLGPWSEANGVVPPQTWETEWSGKPCAARRAVSDTIWWLSDPLYIVDGNDRWTEHINRNMQAEFWFQQLDTHVANRGERFDHSRWAWVTRRGSNDSFEYLVEVPRPRARLQRRWTSLKAARYHFVPDFDGEGFGHPTWRLMGDLDDEGYTPLYGPFYEVPIQIARFRVSEEEGSGHQRIATATSVKETPIADAVQTAYLVLTDAPESFPLQLNAPFNEGRAVFLAEADAKPYVTSVEVLAEAGIGWHREMLEPLTTTGPGISDLLLFQPQGLQTPNSLLAAVSLMLGSTAVDLQDSSQLGLYWETYGAPLDGPVSFELVIKREEGGLIQRIRRLLPGGPEEASGRLTWTEPSLGLVFPKSVVLDIEGFNPGGYEILLRASWEGQEAGEVSRWFVVR